MTQKINLYNMWLATGLGYMTVNIGCQLHSAEELPPPYWPGDTSVDISLIAN